MTTKPKAKKFRIRRDSPLSSGPADAPQSQEPETPESTAELDAIKREGLTGRQLRMARRVAQKQGMAVTSDFDAVRQLRAAGIDPFQRNAVLDLVAPPNGPQQDAAMTPQGGGNGTKPLGRIQLPQTVPQPGQNTPSTEFVSADNRASEIMKIQRDIVKRRRRKAFLLMTRLAFFVLLPTLLVGYYFAKMATPMYATNSEFVIQQADSSQAPGGLGSMFAGTGMATQQDAITVQSYLASRAAMLRLDGDHGFREHFSDPSIDQIQRLEADATNETMFKLYQDRVKISYDPTEGILRMEVIAASPEASQEFSNALIGYAEEQVDQLSLRLREDQMAGARASYESAEAKRAEALAEWLKVQEETQTVDATSETAALIGQVSALEQQRQQLQLNLTEKLGVRRPNQAQVDALRNQIKNIDDLINDLRAQMTTSGSGNSSVAQNNTRLRLAEENYTFQTLMVQQALTQMEAAQIEASRQVRYLSMGVEPVAPDEATYPRVFENTVLAALIFAGIYLMISLTASILREQVTA